MSWYSGLSVGGRYLLGEKELYQAVDAYWAAEEAQLVAAVCEHLAGPWGRVPGDGALVQVRDRDDRLVRVERRADWP